MALLRTKRLALGELTPPGGVVYVCPAATRAVVRSAMITVIYLPTDPAPLIMSAEMDVTTAGGVESVAWYEWLRDNQFTSHFNGQLVLHPGDQLEIFVNGNPQPAGYYHISGAELPMP